jgi:hypothetical protein
VVLADRLIAVKGNVVSDLDRVCALVRAAALDRLSAGGVWKRKEVTVP